MFVLTALNKMGGSFPRRSKNMHLQLDLAVATVMNHVIIKQREKSIDHVPQDWTCHQPLRLVPERISPQQLRCPQEQLGLTTPIRALSPHRRFATIIQLDAWWWFSFVHSFVHFFTEQTPGRTLNHQWDPEDLQQLRCCNDVGRARGPQQVLGLGTSLWTINDL